MSSALDRVERVAWYLSIGPGFLAESIAAFEFPDSKNGYRYARELISTLRELELLLEHWLPLYPMPPVGTEPLFRWSSGEPASEFDEHKFEYATKTRFREPARRALFVTATEKTAVIFGGPKKRAFNRLQANHHAHVGTILAHLILFLPEQAAHFRGEHMLRWHPNSKRPDAVLYDDDFQPYGVHESGGCGYGFKHLRSHFEWIQQWAETRDLFYWLW